LSQLEQDRDLVLCRCSRSTWRNERFYQHGEPRRRTQQTGGKMQYDLKCCRHIVAPQRCSVGGQTCTNPFDYHEPFGSTSSRGYRNATRKRFNTYHTGCSQLSFLSHTSALQRLFRTIENAKTSTLQPKENVVTATSQTQGTQVSILTEADEKGSSDVSRSHRSSMFPIETC
jgi:hypothetical protein